MNKYFSVSKSLAQFGVQQIANVGMGVSKSKTAEYHTTFARPLAPNNRNVSVLADDDHDAFIIGLEGKVRNLGIEGRNTEISSPVETHAHASRHSSAGVGGNLASRGLSANASTGSSHSQSTHHAHGNLVVTQTTSVHAQETATFGAPVPTKYSDVTAKRMAILSPQDTINGKGRSLGGNIGMGAGISGGISGSLQRTHGKNVGQVCGLFTSDTAFIDVEEKITLNGGVLSVGQGARAKPSRDQLGTPEPDLYEIAVRGDGDCALHCLGLNRPQAIRQLIQATAQDPEMGKGMLKDIQEQINEAESRGRTLPGITDNEVYQALVKAATQAGRGGNEALEATLLEEVNAYLTLPETCRTFIQLYYGTWQSYFSYEMIDLLARINDFHLSIKRLSRMGTYDTVHERPGNGHRRILLHTLAGTEGGFYDATGGSLLNHFNLLSPTPGVLRAPTIEHQNLHNRITQSGTSIGAQAGFGGKSLLPGFAQIAHNKNVQGSVTQATISENFTIETKSNLANLNRDGERITINQKEKETKINAFVPIPGTLSPGKFWDGVKDLAGAVAEKPLWSGTTQADATLPDFVDVEDQEKALNRKKELARNILDALQAQGSTYEEARYILLDEGMQNVLNKSSGYLDRRNNKTDEQIQQIPGKPIELTVTEGHIDPLDRCLGIMSDGATALSNLAEKYPTLVHLSMTAVQLALSGPAGYARDQVCEAVGIHDVTDELTSRAKGWFSGQLQDRLGIDRDYADVYSEAGSFGLMFGLSTLGGASKDKVLDAAKGVRERIGKWKTQPWTIREGQEWKQKIHGKAQKTKTDGHEVASYRIAITEAKKENIEAVHLNHGYNRATGEKIKSNRRPDVLTVDNSGKVNAYEVPSKSDDRQDLFQRNWEAIAKLPKEVRGEVKVIDIKK